MDAAFPKPFEHYRLLHGSHDRKVPMAHSLTEAEFTRAVSDAMPRLVAIARRLSGSDELAQESVQNALLRASKSWRRFRGQSEIETWITRIVIRCVRDVIAREQRQKTLVQPFAEQQDQRVRDVSGGPSQQALDRELEDVVREAVRCLPERQREVFALATWQGLAASEIAELLQIKHGAVHSNLHAARSRLRELLDSYLSADGGLR
ncbi:MAG: sigma-70 family RNA polymerase sigma factor [Planctomycetota bacterium]